MRFRFILPKQSDFLSLIKNRSVLLLIMLILNVTICSCQKEALQANLGTTRAIKYSFYINNIKKSFDEFIKIVASKSKFNSKQLKKALISYEDSYLKEFPGVKQVKMMYDLKNSYLWLMSTKNKNKKLYTYIGKGDYLSLRMEMVKGTKIEKTGYYILMHASCSKAGDGQLEKPGDWFDTNFQKYLNIINSERKNQKPITYDHLISTMNYYPLRFNKVDHIEIKYFPEKNYILMIDKNNIRNKMRIDITKDGKLDKTILD